MEIMGFSVIWFFWALLFLIMTLVQWPDWSFFPLNLMSFLMNISFLVYFFYQWEERPQSFQAFFHERSCLFLFAAFLIHLLALYQCYRQDRLRKETLAICLRRDY